MGRLQDEVWKNWEKTGRTEYLKLFKSYLSSSSDQPIISLKQHKDIFRLIYDLIWNGVKGNLKRDLVVTCLGELIALQHEVASVVVDVIAIIDTETGLVEERKRNEQEKAERNKLAGIIREAEKYLSDGLVKERLEIDTLGESAILKYPKKFFTTVIKLKTKLFYKQQKFNLFREECEGYAKLITELNQDLSTVTPSYIIEVIKSVIGYFNLDPNRVLDIILESFECQPHQHAFFVSLLQEYLPDSRTMCELLSFKYSYYLSSNNEEKEETPASLYLVTALMIQYNIMTLEDVYPLLAPSDASIQKMSDKELKEAREFVRKLNVVSTNKGNDKEGEEKEDTVDTHTNNQKFGLLEALLKVGCWSHAERLMCQLPAYYCVAQPHISLQLCNLIHATMDPVYQQHSGLCPRIKAKSWPALTNQAAPPLALHLEDLKHHVVPMLLALGPHAHKDVVLLYKILRLVKTSFNIKDDGSSEVREISPDGSVLYFEALTLFEEVILPSLSLLPSNCCLAEEIWAVLRVYPYQHRYRLYSSWKKDTMDSHPVLLKTKAAVQKSIKRIMQRVSKENVKPTGRTLGKLSHATPGLVFSYILSQIQVFENLIGPVVDSFKYLTNLSFDVLSFCISESLSDPSRDRTKTDGTSISIWLTALATFCGTVYKKYNIDLTGLLQYVANQLKAKHSLDLLIVKEIVQKMGGIEAAEEMTAEQIDALSGGEILRSEAATFTQVKNTRKSSQRLKDCLMDNHLAVPLVLLMAQQGSCVVYQETENDHLKLVGKLFDQCHDTLVQFGTFLASNLSQDDYTSNLPSIEQLLTEFHVNADLAFFLARPMFNHLINTKFEEMRKTDKQWKQRSAAEKQVKHAEAAQLVMEPITAAVIPLHPAKVWDDISSQFLTSFWSLTMYDLHVPEQLYEKEIKKLKEAPSKLHENKDLNTARRKKEAERLNNLMERLQEEERRHKEHVERVMVRLKQEKDGWFLSRAARSAKNETITQFLQLCLFPRCIFTASDAIYAAKFVSVIHMLKTPNFSTLICYDRIFCDITYTVTCCTENEANRYGRFLSSMLDTVMKWHADKEVFERECAGYPGFVTKFRVTTVTDGKTPNETDTVDYENYRHVCHKWHYKIAKALVVCLESKDFVQIRNSLIVLTKIKEQFPVIKNLSTVIEKRIEKVCEEEKDKRQDLYIKARSYQGQLQAKKSKMMNEAEFHHVKRGADGKSKRSSPTPSPVKREESREEGEIKEKKRSKVEDKDKDKERESKEKSVSREPKDKDKDRSSRDKESSERHKSSSRDRSSTDREKPGDMGPPLDTSQREGSRHRSQDPDSDRDFKRKRREDREKKEKSPVEDRLQKKERLKREKEEEKEGEKEKEKEGKRDRSEEKEKDKTKEKKQERKRERDEHHDDTGPKKRRDEAEGRHVNGDSDRRKVRR